MSAVSGVFAVSGALAVSAVLGVGGDFRAPDRSAGGDKQRRRHLGMGYTSELHPRIRRTAPPKDDPQKGDRTKMAQRNWAVRSNRGAIDPAEEFGGPIKEAMQYVSLLPVGRQPFQMESMAARRLLGQKGKKETQRGLERVRLAEQKRKSNAARLRHAVYKICRR